MKNTILLVPGFFTAGYGTAVAAQLSGFLSVDFLTLPAFIGSYVAAGVLALAFRDYASVSHPHRPSRRAATAGRPQSAQPAALGAGAHAWSCQTLSA